MINLSAEQIIRSQARETLKNNYVKAVIALLIVLLPLYMIDGTTTVTSCAVMNLISDEKTAQFWVYAIGYPVELIAGYLLSPVINGYIRAYYKTAYSSDMDLKDLFYYFENRRYAKTLRLNFSFLLRMLIPILLLYTPLIIFEIIAGRITGDFYGSVLYKDCYFILAVLSTMTTTLYALRYFTVFTICVDNEDLSVKEIYRYNKHIMKDKTVSAAKLIFSFTPWILLSMLILPMLYVIPYMTQSLCIACKWMKQSTFEVM